MFSNCDPNNHENDWNLTTQEVYSTIEISCDNSPHYSINFGDYQTWIELIDGQIFHTTDISEYNVIDGETFYYPISLSCSGYPGHLCSDVMIKTYQNEILIDEKSFQYGYANEPWNDPLGKIIYCDPLFPNDCFKDTISLVAE